VVTLLPPDTSGEFARAVVPVAELVVVPAALSLLLNIVVLNALHTKWPFASCKEYVAQR